MTEQELPEKIDPTEETPEEMVPAGNEVLIPEEEESKDDKHDKSTKHRHKKESRTEKLEEELAEFKDKYLRLYSEFDNYRKRTLKEKIELSRNASEGIISSLLPVIDDLERAIRAFESGAEDTAALKNGVLLIYNKWMNILTQEGLEVIPSLGEDFNTDFHEAITNIPAPDPSQKGKVLDEIEKGYKLNGKVIRFAKVVVGN